MAKIGIVTFHKAHNFGALLQAMALRTVIDSNGYDVRFVDYWPEYHCQEYKFFNKSYFRKIGLIGKFKYLVRFFQNYNTRKKNLHKFNDFIKKHIEPYCNSNLTDSYDCIIYGSDQIWRKMPEIGYNYDCFYFGINSLCTDSYCSYAASMGIEDTTDTDRWFLKDSISKFAVVNVRETSLKLLLESCGLERIQVGLDPTLLLSREKWSELLSIQQSDSEKYLLFYDLIPDSFDYREIQRYALENNLRIKIVTGAVSYRKYDGDNVRIYNQLNPAEFVQLIAGAHTVFSSSFHGLVFSIIFEKNFYACFKKNALRAESLLNQLGLQHRLISPGNPINYITNSIDYVKVRNTIAELSTFSIENIKKMIKGYK